MTGRRLVPTPPRPYAAAGPVPNSAGTSRPRYAVPAPACDCHVHIYDPRFPMAWPELRGTANASVAEYRLLQERLGTTRAVVVQPAAYGTDNRVTLDAVRELGPENARGIAVLNPDASDAQLRELHEGGIRGLRFWLHEPRSAITTPGMIAPLAHRIQELGWHVQLHLRAAQVLEMRSLLESLPGTLVFDHMARLPQPEGTYHPAFRIVARLVEAGRAWVKLSGPYLDTQTGSPRYADASRIAAEWARLAPERMLWGSDWPHPTEHVAKPDDAALIDLLEEWAPGEAARRRILVDNPARLYGFAP